MHIVDRRPNPKGKSLTNRQRFMARHKGEFDKAFVDSLKTRKVGDQGGMTVPIRGTEEPVFHHNRRTGRHDRVYPGNKEYLKGDEIPRPQGGAGGTGNQGSPDGTGQDAFEFVLSREEYLDLFLADLELPDMVRKQLKDTEQHDIHRAGFAVTGTRLDVKRTFINAKGRGIALRRPSLAAREEAKQSADAFNADDVSPEAIEARRNSDRLERRAKIVPYIDPIDVRYRRFEQTPRPNSQAVMFCLMDVSGSMTEEMKMLAKRFFMLLNVFLKRHYKRVDIVFIRHTSHADEVDEEKFFYSKETGGTVVSTALQKMLDIIKDRYPPSAWNIYGLQASDGDNYGADSSVCAGLLDKILPITQHFAYVETGEKGLYAHASDLWRGYEPVRIKYSHFAMRHIQKAAHIFPVFHELFERKARQRSAAYSLPIEAHIGSNFHAFKLELR